MKETDVLIIGSGVAGLFTAIKIAEQNQNIKITILSKNDKDETNTKYAQGGVAAVWDLSLDHFDKHVADTLDAGDGLCNKDVVNFVVEEGPHRVQDLIDWGCRFDKVEESESYHLGMEGGHSAHRILHYKDLTGWEIQRGLLAKIDTFPNVEILEDYFAIDIVTQHHLGYNITRVTPGIQCYGIYALDKKCNNITLFLSKSCVLATGGAGQIYRNTTNPIVATGDGIAMFYRAKGTIENMEFVQFHPTALFNPKGENPDFLISEAVRGFGGILRTDEGEEFMHRYDSRKSLAPRDIVARAIDNEMKKAGGDFVYLDCTHTDEEEFIDHFPTIYDKCKSLGIDPLKDYIPVVPACHYLCGGIKVDARGRSSINRLYAAGESTCTGLHGANRLASNSLLEGMVYGDRIAKDILNEIDKYSSELSIPKWDAKGTIYPKEKVLMTQSWKELKDIMSSYVGIVRSNVRLKRASDRLSLLYQETENLYQTTIVSPQLCELRNLITIGYLVTRSAQMRRESRGLHFTTDFPDKLGFIDLSLL